MKRQERLGRHGDAAFMQLQILAAGPAFTYWRKLQPEVSTREESDVRCLNGGGSLRDLREAASVASESSQALLQENAGAAPPYGPLGLGSLGSFSNFGSAVWLHGYIRFC